MAQDGNSTFLLVGLGALAAAGLVAVAISKAGKSAESAAPSRRKLTALEAAADVQVRRITNALPPLGIPLAAPITTRFGHTSSLHTDGHHGLDLGIAIGHPVFAPVDGVVTGTTVNGVGWGKGNGNSVTITANGYRWQFLHLNNILVQKGQRVTRGTILGASGNTGRSTGPHLHVQITDLATGVAVDPIQVYPEGTFEPSAAPAAPVAALADVVEVHTLDHTGRVTWLVGCAGDGKTRITRRAA